MREQEKKKIEKEKRIEEAKSVQAAHIVTSGSEEDSRRKAPLASRTYRVLGAVAKKSVFQDLKEMTDEEVEELGQEIDKCYRVKVAQTEDDDTAVIFGDLHSKLSGGRSSKETIIPDSGCTRDIVAESIVRDLGLKMNKLEKPMVINGADGNTLNPTSRNVFSKLSSTLKLAVLAIFLHANQQKTFQGTLGTQDHTSIVSKTILGPSRDPSRPLKWTF